jgi:hypothetical protein
VPDEEIGFERVRVVVIEGRPLFQAQVVTIAIVPIVLEDRHGRIAEGFENLANDRRLARTRTTSNADDKRRPHNLILTEHRALSTEH